MVLWEYHCIIKIEGENALKKRLFKTKLPSYGSCHSHCYKTPTGDCSVEMFIWISSILKNQIKEKLK